MNGERDRVVSFQAAADGSVDFSVLHLVAPQEIDGLEAARWRKVFRSPPYPSTDAAFDAALEQFVWIDEAWRRQLANLAPPGFPG